MTEPTEPSTPALEPVAPATPPTDSLLTMANSIDFSKGKPEGFPDDFWDGEKNAPRAEKLYEAYNLEQKKALGLRQKLSRGEFEGKAPEDVKEYVLDLDESLKSIVGDDDPIFNAAKLAAKEAGLPKEAFAKFMTPVIAEIAKLQAENAPKEPTQEEIDAYKASEIAKLGEGGLKVAGAVKSFVDELEAKGILTAEDKIVAQGMITTADSLRVFNRLRSAMSNSPVPEIINVASSASKAELGAKLAQAAKDRNEAEYNRISAELRKLG